MASEILAKHDERYMPKEVADALKARGACSTATEAGREARKLTPGSQIFAAYGKSPDLWYGTRGSVRISSCPKPF